MVTELVNLILELNSVFDLETVFLRKRRDVVIIRSHTIKGKARLGWFCWLVEGERESSWWVWPYLLGGWCLLQSYPPSQLTGPPILLLLLILLLLWCSSPKLLLLFLYYSFFSCSFSPTSITFLSFSCPKFQSTHSSVNEEWKTMVREPGRPPGSCHLAKSESERVRCGDESVMAAERGNGPATSRLLGRVWSGLGSVGTKQGGGRWGQGWGHYTCPALFITHTHH